ncbi:MAG: Rieske 2Fe-2S domain-containing protein [Bacteroidota bacterium]
MSVNYAGVLWNRQKRIYDIVMVVLVAAFLVTFIVFNAVFHPEITAETLIIRAFGSLALVMLHVILCIGPLARLNTKFLPILYNRRHLGVTMFLMSLVHGAFSILQFHGGGNENPLLSVFLSNTNYGSFLDFPFQTLGFVALIILFLMAASSHDFWLNNLSPKVWKAMHMMVYLAYGLVIAHVVLGVIQLENNPVSFVWLMAGMIIVVSLHVTAGWKSFKQTTAKNQLANDGFVLVSKLEDIPEDRAKVINTHGESIAVFKYSGKLSAISNVCKHQNGPLGEGKIIDGCITCPWHGYQYRPEDGCSPPPFTEKVSTYDLKIEQGQVWVNPKPYPEGTERPPVVIS